MSFAEPAVVGARVVETLDESDEHAGDLAADLDDVESSCLLEEERHPLVVERSDLRLVRPVHLSDTIDVGEGHGPERPVGHGGAAGPNPPP